MGKPQQSGGKPQASKKDGAAKRGRNKNADGVLQTAKNTHDRLLAEAKQAERKLEKLLARHMQGLPGGIAPGSERHKASLAHIADLEARAAQ